jgi:hypothetical protein
MYEYRTLEPRRVSKKESGRRGRLMEGMNETGVQYIYIWKCYNKTPCIIIIY